MQLTLSKQYDLFKKVFGLIKFITELQNFNLVQSRDQTDCQSIESLAYHQGKMIKPVVDSWHLFGNFVGYRRPFLWNQSKRRYISERRKNWFFNKIRFFDPSDDNESDISRRQKHKLSKRMKLDHSSPLMISSLPFFIYQKTYKYYWEKYYQNWEWQVKGFEQKNAKKVSFKIHWRSIHCEVALQWPNQPMLKSKPWWRESYYNNLNVV